MSELCELKLQYECVIVQQKKYKETPRVVPYATHKQTQTLQTNEYKCSHVTKMNFVIQCDVSSKLKVLSFHSLVTSNYKFSPEITHI